MATGKLVSGRIPHETLRGIVARALAEIGGRQKCLDTLLFQANNLLDGSVFAVTNPYGQITTSAVGKSSVFIAKSQIPSPNLMTTKNPKVHWIVDRLWEQK